MKLLAEQIPVNCDNMVRKTALAVDQAVVIGTPVDEGRARSNWVVEIGSPADGVIEPYSPGHEASTAAENAQRAMDQARSKVAEYEYGRDIHITNNLPYIQRLNDGHSAQAPKNFVEKAAMQAAKIINSTSLLKRVDILDD